MIRSGSCDQRLTFQIDAQVPNAAVERDEIERRRRFAGALLHVPPPASEQLDRLVEWRRCGRRPAVIRRFHHLFVRRKLVCFPAGAPSCEIPCPAAPPGAGR